VSAFGELPLYKTHEFERSVKKWFISQSNRRQAHFKEALQEVERNVWASFPFTNRVMQGLTINTSLSEPLNIKGDYLYASFMNEIVDSNYETSEFEEKLQPVNPTFNNDKDFRRDI
jgi:hypothetical protein